MKSKFLRALPVWIKGRELERNLRVQFKAFCREGNDAEIHLATSGIYQLWVNGRFVSYGPARAGRNHFRMEMIPIGHLLNKPCNTVVVEVVGYNTENYYIQNQPSFFQGEIVMGNDVAAATGFDYSARVNPYYYQKMQRYGWQRPMLEGYRYTDPQDAFFTDASVGHEELDVCCQQKIIERTAPYPLFETMRPEFWNYGKVEFTEPGEYTMPRGYDQNGKPDVPGFEIEELDCFVSKKLQEMNLSVSEGLPEKAISKGSYRCYRLPHNATGMLRMRVECRTKTTMYVTFDEILTENVVDPVRSGNCSAIRFDFEPGEYLVQTFEVYTMQYFNLIVTEGRCETEPLAFIEYKHPPVSFKKMEDRSLQKIVDAAIETYRQCAVDLFIDCPGRERAGWLCDSYFTAQAEYALTGKNTIERSFLENFLHEDTYEHLPEGMLPMCYPADFPNGKFIPNWAMFFVVQLHDFYRRTGDVAFVSRFREKVDGLLRYFEGFENDFGLLENLDSWVFVEWSHANDAELVQGVNFPSNMMYCRMLSCVGELFGDQKASEKAERIKQVILQWSFDGTFFRDHADMVGGKLVFAEDVTEVCQYYAFFTGVATRQSHGELFDRLLYTFGPERDLHKTYPQVEPAQPFIGNYLRLHILHDAGYQKEVENDIRKYFLHMAETTGTLWEKSSAKASCNHGFASNVLYLLS